MKILILNDLLIGGGAEMQGLREKNILEKNGHKVYYLTFDSKFPSDQEYSIKNGFINIALKNSGISKIINKLCINKSLYNRILFEINRISPDIIHINNLYLAPKTQYRALSNFNNTIQTIRDYSAVCPLNTCIKLNKEVCSGMDYNNCLNVCGKNLKLRLKIMRNLNNNEQRKQSINNYICPSKKLTEYCKKHNYDIECINNPFDFEKFRKFNKKVNFADKKYLYYGAINNDKGVLPLIKAFEKFREGKQNVELILAGKVSNDVKKEIDYYIESNKIRYLGYLKYEDMINVLEEVYAIVVPSQWMENYPNTVLEAKATETLVIGSNRGGIPEMIQDNRFIFDIDNIDKIVSVLENSYFLSVDEYKAITKKNREESEKNNSIDIYYKKIIDKFNFNLKKNNS